MARFKRTRWRDDPRELWKYAGDLDRWDVTRQALNACLLGLYWNRPLPMWDLPANQRYASEYMALYQQLQDSGENVLREVIDGSLALSVRKLQCEVLPTGAEDSETKRACEVLGHLVDQVLEESDFHDLAMEAARNGHICDIGPITGNLTPDGEILWEGGQPNQTMWPRDDSRKPRTLINVAAVPRENLQDTYPSYADQLEDVPFWAPRPIPGVDDQNRMTQRESDTVMVIDATYTKMGSTVGLRALSCQNGVVLNGEGQGEPWDFEDHPTIVYRWSPSQKGFGGCSLASVIASHHIWVNQFVAASYRALRGAGPKIIAHKDDIENASWSDLEYDVIPFEGPVAPQVVMPSVVSPELLNASTSKKSGAYSLSGVNQNLAQGMAPPNLTSGRAQREYISGASARLLPQNRALERLYRDAAKVVIMLVAQLFERRGKVVARSVTGEFIREITYRDVKALLTSKKYRVSFGLVSGLSLDPAGRLQDLKDLSELLPGEVDAGTVAANLDLPDTQALSDDLNAGRKLIDKMISLALNGGPDGTPVITTPSRNLGADGLQALQRKLVQRLNLAELKPAGYYPKANVAAARKLLAATQDLIKQVTPPPPPMPMPGAPGPGMMAAPPPPA